MEVHVFVFEHRHGRDISAHATAELAYAAAATIARRDWADARFCDKTLPESPPADDAEAVEMYFEARAGHEFYAIVTCAVEGAQATPVGA